jgi:hypothetical protein
MKSFRFVFIPALIAIGAAWLSCSFQQLSGGTDTETGGTRVAGLIKAADGSLASTTVVMLIPAGFNPVSGGKVSDSLTDTTDINGAYSIVVRVKGAYNLQAVSRDNRSRSLKCGIPVTGDSVHVQDVTLTPPGSIVVSLPQDIDRINGYVYVPGTTIFVLLNGSTDTIVLDSVPAGIIPSINYSATNIVTSPVIRYDVSVESGRSTSVFNPSWLYACQLDLNTTITGANIAGNVYGFPVLIRLNSINFKFSQAQTSGADIRFTKPDNTFLPYEIERWDSVSYQAEIWVKLDSIYGNDSMQSITMYWGNPNAADESNGAAVFDTTSGFTAVWHLNTDCSDITTGKHDGTNFGVTDTVGIIGGAKKFDGSSYIQVPGLLGTPQSITLSAWVHLDSTISFSQEIVSLGDAVALRADRVAAPYYGTEGFFCSTVSASDTVFVFTNTGVFISKTGWRYLVYTVDSARHVQSMYIDGIFQCSTNDINPINYSGLGTNTFLGSHGNKKTASYAFGCIDEARVCRVARSADWIKLCYMNQKQQDALVRW